MSNRRFFAVVGMILCIGASMAFQGPNMYREPTIWSLILPTVFGILAGAIMGKIDDNVL